MKCQFLILPIFLITIFLIMGFVAGATSIQHLKQTDTSISGEVWVSKTGWHGYYPDPCVGIPYKKTVWLAYHKTGRYWVYDFRIENLKPGNYWLYYNDGRIRVTL